MRTKGRYILSEKKKLESIIRDLPPVDTSSVHDRCTAAVKKAHRKIVVLDDDPTGTQVVHDVPVYTEWGLDDIRQAFLESDRMFFILTNSRGMSAAETVRVHQEIAARLLQVVRETQQDILLISRSDSTLRGHYPLETKVINDTWAAQGDSAFDGEIIVPFFSEGGRYTYENIHYVEQNGTLIPAAETEFARDRTFPYSKSNLCEWIGEKTEGASPAEDVCVFSVNDLRTLPAATHEEKLMSVSGFRKIVVNAVSYTDLELFIIPLMGAVLRGKKFLFRSAASLTKVLGLVSERDLLEHETLTDGQNNNGGLIVVGSYVEKTTSQLMDLFNLNDLDSFYSRVTAAISDLKSRGADIIIYYIHWGEEYQLVHNEAQGAIAQKLCDLGVDVIIGGHPHVVQDAEVLTSTADPSRKTLCFYSLGNYVSNQNRLTMDAGWESEYTENGLTVILTIRKYSNGQTMVTDVGIVPTWVHRYTDQTTWKNYHIIVPLPAATNSPGEYGLYASDFGVAHAEESYRQTTEQMKGVVEAFAQTVVLPTDD